MGVYRNIFWIIFSVIYLLSNRGENLVVFLDVGQGDSTLIQQGSTQILVDGGPDLSVLYGIGEYMPFGDRYIEYIYLTHPHNDHLVGILHILKDYKVGKIFYNNVCYENPNYRALLQYGENLVPISADHSMGFGSISIRSLWPDVNSTNLERCKKSWDGNINNDSIVLELSYLNKKFLLMGDAEEEVERYLTNNGSLSHRYDVLKAGHHCSKTSSSETFLKTARPHAAICSVAQQNSFGHPSGETLKTFDRMGVQYFLTYDTGNIQIK